MGTWIDESLGVYVGWTVIEDSFADGMPLRDRNRDLTLIFSGEEYGHRNMAAEGDESQAAFLLRLAANDHSLSHRTWTGSFTVCWRIYYRVCHAL